MWPILQSLVDNCSVAVEYTDKGLRLVANGPVGVLALLVLCGLAFVCLRRRRRTLANVTRRIPRHPSEDAGRFKEPAANANKGPSANRSESPYLLQDQYVPA
ncbi:MAG: hypothetical protein QOI05_2245 [Bradyrhizobium sp.]|nr:hypothetical protein [Bradyrhizobium sp.]